MRPPQAGRYIAGVQPWWRPANLIVSHVVSSYLTLTIVFVLGWALDSSGLELLCIVAAAPLTLPLLLADYARHYHSIFVHPSGFPFPLLVAGLYVALFALRSVRAARRYTRHRQLTLGLCLACGYDLTANASGTCPECGSPIADDVA